MRSLTTKLLTVCFIAALVPLAVLAWHFTSMTNQAGLPQLDETRNMLSTLVVSVVAIGLVTTLLSRNITGPINRLLDVVRTVAKGDLTVNPQIESRDEIGMLAAGIGGIISRDSKLVEKIKSVACQMDHLARNYATSSRQIAAESQKLACGAHQIAKKSMGQANAARDTICLMAQIVTRATEARQSAEHTATEANEHSKSIDEVLAVARENQSRMNDIIASSARSAVIVRGLRVRSREIDRISSVVRELGDQTNLLALNAAIQATRIGTCKRRFGVTAEEVRKLSEESRKAAAQIAKLSGQIQNEITTAAKSIEENVAQLQKWGGISDTKIMTTLQEAQLAAKQAAARGEQTALRTGQQMELASQVRSAMSLIVSASEETSATIGTLYQAIEKADASVEENTSGAQALAHAVRQLYDIARQYKLQLRENITVSADMIREPAKETAIELSPAPGP